MMNYIRIDNQVNINFFTESVFISYLVQLYKISTKIYIKQELF